MDDRAAAMTTKVSMRKTIEAVRNGVEGLAVNWPYDKAQALRDLRFAKSMLTRAEQALQGELEIEEQTT